MSKVTKLLEFDQKTRKIIWQRENNQCFFCRMKYHMESTTDMGYQIADIMHYIPKSKMGLGVPENGILGCRYHHSLLDNGNKGLREEMLSMMEKYLEFHYPNWDREKLVYHKYNF